MDRVSRTLEILKSKITTSSSSINRINVYKGDLLNSSEFSNTSNKEVMLPLSFPQEDERYFIEFKYQLSSFEANKSYRFRIITGKEDQWDAVNPQMLAYINDELICGLDMNHQEIDIPSKYQGQEVKIGLHVYTGMEASDWYLKIDFIEKNEEIIRAYYDLKVAYDVLKVLKKNTDDYDYLEKQLSKAVLLLNSETSLNEGLELYLDHINKYIYGEKFIKSPYTVHAIGHTHIDVAWLWDLRQTKEKVVRSYQTALNFQKKYKDYKFMASQPVLYEMLKESKPDLYSKIKEAHKNNQWTSEGAMYLEADCNLISGESLIRQLEWGQSFFENELDMDSKVLWLPDVFGYSAALPQILKGFDIEMFVTSKISWNDTNILPFDSFQWMGIDGSKIPTQFITTMTLDKYEKGIFKTIYEGNFTPSEVLGSVKRHQQKEIQPNILMPYGFGDGGGGANENMLEYGKRLIKGIVGMPRVVSSDLKIFTKAYYDKSVDQLPVWEGELYLEYHRGTYTTNGKIKKYHRTLEDLLIKAEKIEAQLLLNGYEINIDLSSHWQILLLNQFHDILPGTSIKKVYDDAYGQLEKSIKAVNDQLDDVLINENDEMVYVNVNSHPYKETFIVNTLITEVVNKQLLSDGRYLINTSIDLDKNTYLCDNPFEFETYYYKVKFNDSGEIISLFDKEAHRNILKENGLGNKLSFYRDNPKEWDAWDISDDYETFPLKLDIKSEVKCLDQGNLGIVIEVKKTFKSSSITQKIVFYHHNRGIDFETSVDWHEQHVLLKTDFELNIQANHCKYSIQYGYVERPIDSNHSYNQAMFEVCSQHWANLSEKNYNISLMSNDKFGYSCNRDKISLTLIKSPTWPNPVSDQGVHSFKYRLLPSTNHFHDMNLHSVFKDYANPPILVSKVYEDTFNIESLLPDELSLESFRMLKTDIYQLRIVELSGGQGEFKLQLPYKFKKLHLCQVNGKKIRSFNYGDIINIKYRGFEIITLEFEV